jgi:hypothetical protein
MTFRESIAAAALIGAVSLGPGVGAQSEFANNLKYDSGQDLQPVFEGWARVPNGTFDLYFGYLNRNWVQQLHVPVGPANNIQPGGPDRGQPTFFYTRTQRKVFSVNVPADFDKKELVWTLTANGRTRTVYGHLKADWEITPDGGAAGTQTTQEARSNKAPTIDLAAVAPAPIAAVTELVATVADDGLPVPRGRGKPAVGQESPPGLTGGEKEAPANLPWLSEGGARRPDGLTVRWFVFRGPAEVLFEPPYARPEGGKATTTARFSVPGEYVLRAHADDGLLAAHKDMKVSVTVGSHEDK